MASLDDLLAAQAQGPAASASAPPAGLDALLAQRATGAAIPAPVQASQGFWSQLGSQVGDAGSALGHHLMSLPHGAAQLVENAVSGVANGIAPRSPITSYITQVVDSDNDALAKRESDYQKNTPNSAGAYAGATVGEVAPFLISGPARGLQKAGDYVASKLLPETVAAAAPIVPKMVSAGTQGAVLGAAQPVTSPDYWQQKTTQVAAGGATGSAIPVVGAAIRGAANAAAPILAPQKVVSPLVRQLVGNDPAALAALQNPPQLVAGSTPTTAQLLATPQAVATEKALANSSPAFKQQLTAQANTNNDARLAAIQGVAGTPDDLEAAVQARSDATKPQVRQLLTDPKTAQPVPLRSVLAGLNQLEGSSFSTDPVIARTMSAIRQQLTDASAKTDLGAYTYTPSQLAALRTDQPYIRPDLLDGIRRNLRNTISDNASNGAVSSVQSAGLEPLADRITSAIESANPGYRDYLATYAKASAPINTMEAARSILDNVGNAGRSANSTGAPQVTLSGYSSALSRALLKAPHGISPEAQQTLEGVQADLQRESISNSIRTPGSDTAANLQAPGWLASQLYGQNFAGNPKAASALGTALGGAGGWLSGHYVGAATGAATGGMIGSKIAGMGQARVNEILAKALTDPQFAAELARQAQTPAAPPRIPQLAALLGQ